MIAGRRGVIGGVLALVALPGLLTRSSGPQPERAMVTWDKHGGDVWAWEKTVSGRAEGCEVVAVRLHGKEFPVARSGARFSARVPLRSGRNRIEAVCSGGSGGEEAQQVADLVLDVPLRATPVAKVELSREGSDVVLSAAASTPSRSSGARLTGTYWSERSGNPAPLTLAVDRPGGGAGGGAGDVAGEGASEIAAGRVRVRPPSKDGEYYVTLRVVDADGGEDRSTTYFEVVDGEPGLVDFDREHPRWIDDAVVYGVIPRKFGRPALRATAERLDDLADLGVNTLWLSPVNTTIPNYSGYEVIDYFTIRSDYGTEDDFRALVEQAHTRGMRVLMDIVPNHTSHLHRYYKDAEKYGERSVHYELYDRDNTGTPTHYFDWDWLPNLDFANPDVRRFVTEVMSYWVREYDVDGYRVDVAWGVKERRPDFWPALRRELKRIKPDVYLIAEASARDPYFVAHGFDAAYDWTIKHGEWAWIDVWTAPDQLVERLDAALTNDGFGYGEDTLIFRFLNNNDTGERFVAQHGVGMTRVAAALLFTVHGTPGPYTGDEIGAEFDPYEDIGPLDWDHDPHRLRPYYRTLVRLRNELRGLRSRNFARVEADPASKVYAYVRWGSGTDLPVLVVLNFGAERLTAEVNQPTQFADGGRLVDRLSDEAVRADGRTLRVTMAAYTARIFVPA